MRRGLKSTDPDLRWLTIDDLAAEDAVAARWPDTVTITAGTVQQLATMDPES